MAKSQSVIDLHKSWAAWGTPAFAEVLKAEVVSLDRDLLPLQAGLSGSSYVADREISVMLINASEEGGFIRAKTGVFYAGIIAGCSCADDPTPVDEQTEYCEVLFRIDKQTGEAMATLVIESA